MKKRRQIWKCICANIDWTHRPHLMSSSCPSRSPVWASRTRPSSCTRPRRPGWWSRRRRWTAGVLTCWWPAARTSSTAATGCDSPTSHCSSSGCVATSSASWSGPWWTRRPTDPWRSRPSLRSAWRRALQAAPAPASFPALFRPAHCLGTLPPHHRTHCPYRCRHVAAKRN